MKKMRMQMLNAVWVTLITGGVVLLISAVQKKNNRVCTGIKTELSGTTGNFFLGEKDVLKVINANGLLKGQVVSGIDLHLMESRLEKDDWIANAELFFDKDEVLNVRVQEREPVARVFTVRGTSFYIDNACKRLPISSKVTVRVPMFSGFPSDARKLRSADSLLLVCVKDLAVFIRNDPFWNAQVAQVDITADRTFEMVPVVGSHVVVLGKPGEYEEKFGRLYSFYKQVWTKVGLDKYAAIDVRFNNQVVATRKGEPAINIDSVKAKVAFEQLIKESSAINSGDTEKSREQRLR